MAKLDILDVISRRIYLEEKSEVNHYGLCPFHREKGLDNIPSMAVNTEHQFFYCFVCNESGNADDFLKKYEGWFMLASRN